LDGVINGLYSSAAGMLAQLDQQDAIANNLANSNTAGFKRTTVAFAAFIAGSGSAPRAEASEFTSRSYPSSSSVVRGGPRQVALGCVIPTAFARQDQNPGLLEETSLPTNLAIDGPGSFVVRTAAGETLTRAGNFRLDRSGQLVTQDGSAVLGRNGPVRISGADWSVDTDGNVRAGGAVIDKLRIEVPAASRSASSQTLPARVIQGRLESSNVNAVREMTAMISALRAYEANQKTIQALDQTLDKAINQLGRTA